MKTILTLLLLIVVTASCQLKKSDNTETAVAESTEIDNAEDCTADTVKATSDSHPHRMQVWNHQNT